MKQTQLSSIVLKFHQIVRHQLLGLQHGPVLLSKQGHEGQGCMYILLQLLLFARCTNAANAVSAFSLMARKGQSGLFTSTCSCPFCNQAFTQFVSCWCRADTAERNLAATQDSLADSRQSLETLQTHHSALKQHLERAELHSQDSATQAREFAARVKELSADKEALVSELVTVNKSAAHMKQDFKCLVKCLKGSEPLQAITALLEEAESDSGVKARSSELMWVMKRLCDHFKQSSGTVY